MLVGSCFTELFKNMYTPHRGCNLVPQASLVDHCSPRKGRIFLFFQIAGVQFMRNHGEQTNYTTFQRHALAVRANSHGVDVLVWLRTVATEQREMINKHNTRAANAVLDVEKSNLNGFRLTDAIENILRVG
jgi:hypothetical protein